MPARHRPFLIPAFLLLLCLACDSGKERDPEINEDVDIQVLPREEVIIHSGLAHGGIGLEKRQRMTGALPLPSLLNDVSPPTNPQPINYPGFADLTINDAVIPLNARASEYMDAMAISPLNPDRIVWIFETDFDLEPGRNVISLDVYDNDGVLRASTGQWLVTGAVPSEGSAVNVLLEPPDLNRFPLVSIDVHVTDPNANHAPVPGLGIEHFTLVVADLPVAPLRVVESEGWYRIEFMDITCGRRRIHVHVLFDDPASMTIRSGLSDPLTYGSNHAVLIGIADYPGIQNDLDYPGDDARDVRAALTDSSMWFDEDITLLINRRATRNAVLDAIHACAALMNPWDRFVFFFSGHGATGGDESTQYLCMYENDKWLSVADLNAALQAIPLPGGSLVNGFVLLDACHSGNFIADPAPKGARSKSRPFFPQSSPTGTRESMSFAKHVKGIHDTHILVMSAVAGNQSAWDDWELENGVFTYFLVEGLRCVPEALLSECLHPIGIPAAPANRDHDVWITADEAFDWMSERVRWWVTEEHGFPEGEIQEPQQKGGNGAARFMD